MYYSRKRLSLTFSIGLTLVSIIVVGSALRSSVGATDSPLVAPAQKSLTAAPTAASLHNPTLDNEIWYAFHERHGYGANLAKDSWVPDDDVPNGPQQW